ncbi:MAG: hypothetical protein K2Q10_02190 [Rhodospirillales bacterium]|nr:hypothetical protein [Rhodospirillales bacterium]
MSLREDIFSKGVFFNLPTSRAHYVSACLMEGLSDLGIVVHANVENPEVANNSPVLRPLREALVPRGEMRPGAYGYFVTDISDLHPFEIYDIANDSAFPMAFLSNNDDSTFTALPTGIPFFVVHESFHVSRGGDRYPLGFGLPRHLAAEPPALPSFGQRRAAVLNNFGFSDRQDVRWALELSYVRRLERRLPILRAWPPQRMAPDEYVQALKTCALCLAYGGTFKVNMWDEEAFRDNPAVDACYRGMAFARQPVVMRWDSWRFWEALAHGCVPVHLDFEKYGFRLPVMPEKWRHYVPIDMEDINGSVDGLLANLDRLEEISEAGHRWAFEHYGPAACARRFLDVVAPLA